MQKKKPVRVTKTPPQRHPYNIGALQVFDYDWMRTTSSDAPGLRSIMPCLVKNARLGFILGSILCYLPQG